MSAIVGLVDLGTGNLYIGGDSAGTTKTGDQALYLNKKVFRPAHAPLFLIGVAGSFRLPQVLRFHFAPPRPPDKALLYEEYIATDFCDSLRRCLKGAGLFDEFIGEGIDGNFIVGYQGMLCKVQPNLQALFDQLPYTAIGTGDNISLGSLYSTEGGHPKDRVRLALEASELFSSAVKGPFVIEELPYDPKWAGAKQNWKSGRSRKYAKKRK